jgi:hypothetical protein
VPDTTEYTEFLFVFNDRERAEAAAEPARQLGYSVRIERGDGEGRHFNVRLRLDRALPIEEIDPLVEDELGPLMARQRGRFEGSSTGQTWAD